MTLPPLTAELEDVVYQFAIPAETDSAWFAARLSGLYYSDDEGAGWTPAYASLKLPEPLATLSVLALPSVENKPNVWAGFNGGLLKSRDGGGRWQRVSLADPDPAVVALAASPTYIEDGCLFAATLQDGLWYSRDYGEHWHTGNLGLIDLNSLSLGVSPDFKNDQTVWLGTQTGLFYSRTGGQAWREVTLPVGYESVLSLALSPHSAKENTILVGTETQGLWRSSDKGQSWVRIGVAELTGAINQIAFEPETQTWCVLADGVLWRSNKTGSQWRKVKVGAEASLTAVAACPAGVLVGFEGGAIARVRL